ncbi:MAG: family 20 glycosylhydrolase [Pedobacter sp.]|nr:family 20 glycosylhydrolase [Pedobacter sp.]MDQ8051511.1 family 20 glycosylhydrolase [Pedobacter sp.]
MKPLFLFVISSLFVCQGYAQTDPNLGIIPVPVSIKKSTGSFQLEKTVALISNETSNARTADLLNAFIVLQGGFALREAKTVTGGQKAVVLTSKGAERLPEEGYLIQITPGQVKLVGSEKGLFYAVQTLMQLMPKKTNDKISLPAVEINDYPRFSYRGLHLDVGRHFFPVSFVKKYIDIIAQYKLNTFHWHLTEDQGWRIEIKKYPKLTTVGSVRKGTLLGHYPGVGNDDLEHRGFYTQEEVKQVVAYAASKYITVIPEIEMPGHSSAAIAAYPELSCFPDRDTPIKENAPWSGSRKGKQLQQTWGVFDDVYVPSENTFKFLQDVLDEVMALFPSKYIHIGGDECPKTYWKESPFCQQLIKDLNVGDEHGLQSYFIQRIEKYLNAKGRSIIGWDEILEGGLAPNATVMSWRGEKGGIEAAQQNHNVIMTPGSGGLYIDHRQSNSPDEPLSIGGLAPYTKLYAYDPVPKVLTADQQKYIIGVQANMWTEYMETPARVEYQLFPRIYALAEIAWSPIDKKDLTNFVEQRVPVHLAKLDGTGTNYWVPTPLGQPEGTVKGGDFSVSLKTPIPGAKIFYTLDGFRPSENTTPYVSELKINVPQGQKKSLKTIVIMPSGKRSVVTETVFNNGAPEVKTK